MPFRFHRSVRIAPGIRINLAKRGASLSVGGRGHWLTFGKRGTRATIGLPGTGLSYSTTIRKTHHEAHSEAQPAVLQDASPKGSAWRGWLWILLFVVIVAVFVRTLTL
jgi:hypothetical protein